MERLSAINEARWAALIAFIDVPIEIEVDLGWADTILIFRLRKYKCYFAPVFSP